MRLIDFDVSDTERIRRFLQADQIENLYLLDLIDRGGISPWNIHRWSGVLVSDEIIAINADISCVIPGQPANLSVPTGLAAGCQLLGAHTANRGGSKRISAPLESADAFHRGLGSPKASINQIQRLFVMEQPPTAATIPLSLAGLEDLDALVESTAQMRVDDGEHDPRLDGEELWRKTVTALIKLSKIWLHKQENETVFTIEVGTECPLGAQVGSAYVPSAHRGQGLGTLGMRSIAAQLLARGCQRVSLLAHEENAAAIATHRSAGYEELGRFRLLDFSR